MKAPIVRLIASPQQVVEAVADANTDLQQQHAATPKTTFRKRSKLLTRRLSQ